MRNEYINYNGEDMVAFFKRILPKELFLTNKFADIALKNETLVNMANSIKSYIRSGGRPVIIGDYDGDGITSSSILYKVLLIFGVKAYVILPDRHKDGYGISKNLVDRALKAGYGKGDFIITVDNGINNIDACLYAERMGFKVFVTDHHIPNDDSYLKVTSFNPHIHEKENLLVPNEEICGAFVAFLLAIALIAGEKCPLSLYRELEELAAVGTVTDVMPVRNENYWLLRVVIERWRNGICYNKGLKALTQALERFKKEELDYENIGFYVGPCLNSSGRLRTADLSYSILTDTKYLEAYKKSLALTQLNQRRKDIVNGIADPILNEALKSDSPVLVRRIKSEDYPDYSINELEGVAGLIASKICNATSKPTLFFVDSKFSGRSPIDVHLHKLIGLGAPSNFGYGGHAGACGGHFVGEVADEDFVNLESNMAKHLEEARMDVTVRKIVFPMDTDFNELNRVLHSLVVTPTECPEFVIKDVVLKKTFASDNMASFIIKNANQAIEVLDFGKILPLDQEEINLDELKFKLMNVKKDKISLGIEA